MKKTPLKRVSKKRARQMAEYRKKKAKYLANFLICEPCRNEFRWSPADQIHHMAGRIGEKLLDQDDWLPVCGSCHTKIHDNPAWAREKGYLKSK